MRRIVPYTLVVLVGLLAYHNALENPLVFDDQPLLVDNSRLDPDVQALLRNLTQRGLTDGPVFRGHFRPALMVSLWLNRRLFGEAVGAYRLVNLILHLLCAVLVGLVFRRLLVGRGWSTQRVESIAWVSAGLFAVVPVHVASVALVLKRNSSLSTALILGALLLWARASRSGRHALWYGVPAVLFAALAQLTKEDAAVFPALLLIYGLGARLWVGRWRLAAGSVALASAFPLIYATFWFPSGVTPSPSGSFQYLAAQPQALVEYVMGAFAPERLSLCMDLAVDRGFKGAMLWPCTILASFIVASLWLGFRNRLLLIALGWALACIAPTSSFFPLVLPADLSRVYLASAIPLGLLAVALMWIGERIASARVGRAYGLVKIAPALLVILLWMRATMAVNARHADELSVWRHAVARYPQSGLARAGLCAALLKEKALYQASATCRMAYRIRPSDTAALSLVSALGSSGRLDEAWAALEQARAALGTTWRIALADGHLSWFADRLSRAEQAYEAVLQLNPTQVEARIYLADVKLRLGKPGSKALLDPIVRRGGAPEYPLFEQVKSRLAKSSQ